MEQGSAAPGSGLKAFQFIAGRPSQAKTVQASDKENNNQQSNQPISSPPHKNVTVHLETTITSSPRQLPPSTPATRLPLSELIGSPNERRRVIATVDISPEDHIAWHSFRSPKGSQAYKTPAPSKRARARSSSPPSSSHVCSRTTIAGGRDDFTGVSERPDAVTEQTDPARDLWKRYAQNSVREGLPFGATPALSLNRNPSPTSNLGNVSGLRRWTSCGIEWPTSKTKRRKTRHDTIGEIHEEVIADIPHSAPIAIVDDEKRSRIGSLIARIHESLSTPVLNEEVVGPSSSSPLPERSQRLQTSDTTPIRREVPVPLPDPLDSVVDVRENEDGILEITADTQKKESSSSFGSYDLDLDTFIDAGGTGQMVPPVVNQIHVAPDPNVGLVQHAAPENIISVSKHHSGSDQAEPETNEFDEEIDMSMDDFEQAFSQCNAAAIKPAVLNIIPGPKSSTVVTLIKPEADEYEDDDLDEDSFVAAEVAATQSVSASGQPCNESEKRPIQRYLVINVVEGHYIAANGQTQPEKVLIVEDESTKSIKAITLRQSWFDTRCTKGSFVHVIGQFTRTGQCLVDDNQNMLILHPDHLVSALVVADSFSCIRRAVLQDRVKATSDPSAPQVYGTMLHEIFQEAMQANEWDDQAMKLVIEKIVARHIEDLYDIKLSIPQAIEHLQSKMPELQAWADIFVKSKPGANAVVQDRNDKQVTLSVSKLLDVEEHIWSPMYGLKGNVDATVQVTMHDEQGERVLIVPLEVKTGKNTSNASHRAQTALYTLLLGDRYDVSIAYGLLYYLETSQMSRIPGIRHELRHMIMQRNELACYIREQLSLPPMLKNPHLCGRCYAKTSCFTYHKLTEDGDGDTSGLREKFDEAVKHLKPSHQEFFQKWNDLLRKEETELMKFRRELWTMLSTEREKLGRCFANVVLEPGTAAEDHGSSKINRFRYTFRKRTTEISHSFSESAIIVGEPIVISDEKGHYALAKGYVTEIQKHFISVAVDRRLLNARTRQSGFDALTNQNFAGIMEVQDPHRPWQARETPHDLDSSQMLYRLDKDEFSSGMASVRHNLVQIMNNDVFHANELRDLIVDGKEPRFKPTSTAYSLSGPQSQMEINDDQRAAIDKIMTAQDYALVLGMPGTGKTTTIAHIIRALVAKGKSVLLASYTHTAVDNILLKIRDDNIGVLRLGAIAKVHPKVRTFAVLGSEPKTSIEELQEAYHKPQVVATTCLGINHQVFNERVFDFCIVDEASQITLPVCLGPIRMAKAFVLVGDHYQLPPLVQNREAQEGGLDISLFRLLCERHPSAVITLRHQYRMNAEIMSLSNTLIYDGRLVCGNEATAKRRLTIPDIDALTKLHSSSLASSSTSGALCVSSNITDCWLLRTVNSGSSPVVFLNTDELLPTSLEQARGARITNTCEAQFTTRLVHALLLTGVSASSIGIVTLYRSQLALIKSLLASQLRARDAELVEAHTADRYQGRDKDVIVLSCVRSNDRDIIGELLKDWRRVNVAITRAKKKLIILGSKGTLSRGDALMGRLIKLCDDEGWLVDLPASAANEGEHLWSNVGVEQRQSPTKQKDIQEVQQDKVIVDLTTGKDQQVSNNAAPTAATAPTARRPLQPRSTNSLNKAFKVPSKVASVSKRALLGDGVGGVNVKRPILAEIVNEVVGDDFFD